MKHIFKFAAVVFAAMLLTNCVKENLEPNYTPVLPGDAIVFGGRAGFPSNAEDSRTVYTGKTYEYEGATYEGIDWVINEDMIDIYSPDANAEGNSNVVYRVTGHTEGTESTGDHTRDYATLLPAVEGSAMQWGSNTTHTFYAMYPTDYAFDKTVDGNIVTLNQGVKLDGTTMKGIIPSTFSTQVTLTGNTYTAAPNMRYAYMVAKTEHDPSDETNLANGNKVGLSFVPVVTAVEIELLFPDDNNADQAYYDIYVGEIFLSSASQKLSGGFTAELADWNPKMTKTPTCVLDENVESRNYVTISTRMYNPNTMIDEPIKLTEGQSIKVTVFLLPHTDIADLTVGYTQGAATPKTKSLAAAGTIPAKLKTRITQVKLPVTAIVPDEPDQPDTGLDDASNWMRDLVERKPDIAMNGLSLPGTGGSFTYLSSRDVTYRQQYKSADAEMYSGNPRTESMDFDAQWKLGIRAFEIASDRPSYSSTATLYSQPITCNKQSVGLSVGDAIEMIIKKVIAYPDETAVVILVYQPEDTDPTRNAAYYAEALKAMYTTLEDTFNAADGTDIFKLYTPDMKLSNAAGHVLLMARINQRDEDENNSDTGNGNGSAASNWTAASETLQDLSIVTINGCGTSKDKWGTRGYKSDGDAVDDINWSGGLFSPVDDGEIMESFMRHYDNYLWEAGSYIDGVINYPHDDKTVKRELSLLYWTRWSHVVSRPNPATKPTDADFALGFAYDTSVGFNCWYQEWNRVVATPHHGENIYWFESYYEKLNHVLMTYDMAIDQVSSNQIYVNSLCGYLVTPSISYSYEPSIYGSSTGGQAGDIQGLAKKITPQFYQYVVKRAEDNTTGPTGIVMMDYVSDNPDEGGSHYLPSLIIANNLKSE